MPLPRKVITLRLPRGLARALKIQAKRAKRPFNAFLCALLEGYAKRPGIEVSAFEFEDKWPSIAEPNPLTADPKDFK